MDIQDYTSRLGKRLQTELVLGFIYSLSLLGLSIFELVRYNFYNINSQYSACGFNNLKTIVYIVSAINLITGLALLITSLTMLSAVKIWRSANIRAHEFWHLYYREYNHLRSLILFILQLSVIAFSTSYTIRFFEPNGCDPYIYYSLITNIYVIYNISLIGLALYISLNITWFVFKSVIIWLCDIISTYCVSWCSNGFIRLMGNLGLSTRGRSILQINPNPVTNNPNNINNTNNAYNGFNNNLFSGRQNNNINIIDSTVAIHDLIELAMTEDCVVCIEPQKMGVKFGNCSHWVCEICWSQLMKTTSVCPLCRAQII
jgi:hypothetical protein